MGRYSSHQLDYHSRSSNSSSSSSGSIRFITGCSGRKRSGSALCTPHLYSTPGDALRAFVLEIRVEVGFVHDVGEVAGDVDEEVSGVGRAEFCPRNLCDSRKESYDQMQSVVRLID